jgi:hypothetical protein
LAVDFRESFLTLPQIIILTLDFSVIAIAGLRLHFLSLALTSSNPTLRGAPESTSVTQIEIGYAIMASIVPCLKNFMAAYDAPIQSQNWYQHYGTSEAYTHELASVAVSTKSAAKSSKSVVSTAASNSSPEVKETSRGGVQVYSGGKKGGGASILSSGLGKLRPEQISYEARVEFKDRDGERSSREEGESRRSVESGNSRRMIIKKGVEWSVDYGRRSREADEG